MIDNYCNRVQKYYILLKKQIPILKKERCITPDAPFLKINLPEIYSNFWFRISMILMAAVATGVPGPKMAIAPSR